MDLLAHFAAIAATRQPLWVDGAAYAQRVLTKDQPWPWDDTAAFVALVRKQQQLLQSDVLTIDLAAYYAMVIATQPSLVEAMGARPRTNYALKTLLEDAPSIARVAEVVGAVAQVKGPIPLVMTCPSPKLWTETAFIAAQPGGHAEFGWPDVEKAAVYVAGFLRTFSQAGVDGILIVDRACDGPTNAEELTSYAPVLNVAEHYRWAAGLYQRGKECSFARDAFGFVINDRTVEAQCFGAIVDDLLWAGDGEPALPAANFYFTKVPADAEPEIVLARVQYARGRS
jgi:hypothetical protein